MQWAVIQLVNDITRLNVQECRLAFRRPCHDDQTVLGAEARYSVRHFLIDFDTEDTKPRNQIFFECANDRQRISRVEWPSTFPVRAMISSPL